MEPLIEAWNINNRLNRYLLEALSPEQLEAKVEKSKTPEGHFAHIHNVRLLWIKSAAPDLLTGTQKAEEGANLAALLTDSGERMAEIFARAGSPERRVKGFKPHAAGFLGYLVAHEAFHRAQVELVLRQAGMPISDKVAFGLWEWGVR
jgi:uncharacterized damage-inducible protein DinB